MEDVTGKEIQELLEEMLVLDGVIRENPCGMPTRVMTAIAKGIRAILGTVDTSLNLEQVSRYFGVDARTIRNWRNEYDDFPKGKEAGNRQLSFTAEEIVEWELNHHKRKR